MIELPWWLHSLSLHLPAHGLIHTCVHLFFSHSFEIKYWLYLFGLAFSLSKLLHWPCWPCATYSKLSVHASSNIRKLVPHETVNKNSESKPMPFFSLRNSAWCVSHCCCLHQSDKSRVRWEVCWAPTSKSDMQMYHSGRRNMLLMQAMAGVVWVVALMHILILCTDEVSSFFCPSPFPACWQD